MPHLTVTAPHPRRRFVGAQHDVPGETLP